MASLWRSWRWGLGRGGVRRVGGALLALFIALGATACDALIGPSPTPPPSTGPIPLQASPLETVGFLRARAIIRYGHAGWVHVNEHVTYDLDRDHVTELPDGTPVPLTHTIETWANIDEQGQITQRVIYLRDGDGNVMQTSLYNNGLSWNSSTNERKAEAAASAGAFDRGFGASIGDYVKAGATVTQALATLNGVSVIQIVIDHPFQTPAQYGDYTQPVAGQHITASFDQEGGQLRQLEWVMRLADGSQRRYGLWEVTLEDNVTPPAEVLTEVEGLK